MGLVNETTINFIVKQGEKLGKSFLARPAVTAKLEGLKYMPKQLSTDVVEVSQKTLQKAKTPIEAARLQELASKGLSLNKMASELGVSMNSVRFHLEKHNIVTDAQKEFRILKEYFTASTKEEKAKAFAEIDKCLEQIAKEELPLRKGSSYEDCLQDVRLRFFELAEQSQKDGLSFSKTVLQKVRESRPAIKKEIQTVSLETSTMGKADRAVDSYYTEYFEFKDYFKQLLKSDSGISERERTLLQAYIEEGKSMADLASSTGLLKESIRQILKNRALPKLKHQHDKASSLEYLHKRSESAAKYINKSELSEEINGYYYIDGSYVIKPRW